MRENGGALLGELYTITQAAQVLGVDGKTLQKRLKRAGIEPLDHPEDHRMRLLTEEQVKRLGSPLEQTAKVPRAAMPLGAAIKVLKLLMHRVTKVEERLAAQEQQLDKQQLLLDKQQQTLDWVVQQIDWRMREWEQTAQGLVAVLVEQSRNGDQPQASPPMRPSASSSSADSPTPRTSADRWETFLGSHRSS